MTGPPEAANPATHALLEAEVRGLLLEGRYVQALERWRSATGDSLPQAKVGIEALLNEAREELRRAQRTGAWPEDEAAVVMTGEWGKQLPPLAPPPWLLDAYVEVLVHPYTGTGLAADVRRMAGALPEALRLEAYAQAAALHNLAYQLAIQCYDGKVAQASIMQRLRDAMPGFGSKSYARVIEIGFRDAR